MSIKYPIILETKEPNNDIGLLKIRQADEETQTLVVDILANGLPQSYEGLQAFFCAKLGQTDGLGIVEQKLTTDEMTDPKNGKLEYTMRAQDWQILGTQLAYFSFRKMTDDHTFVQQFSTRDFSYEVTKNVFSDGSKQIVSDGSTYIWTIEDLKRRYEEYIASGKSDWEEFVEQNKEIIESVDPGGQVLSELIRSRKPGDATVAYPDLPTRLDEQIGLNSDFRSFEPEKSFMARVYNETLERGVNAKWIGMGESNQDNAQILEDFLTGTNEPVHILLPRGTYSFSKNITIPKNVTLQFMNGSKLKPETNIVITINGSIIAGDYEIFEDGGGTINLQLSPNPYNISWYSGDSVNKKYDFARRDFKEFKSKVIKIPKPVIGQSGTFSDSSNRTFWLSDGPIIIDDNGNCAEWYIYGEFIAQSSFESFFKVTGPNKPENVYFYGTLQLAVPSSGGFNVDCGIHVAEGARIHFYDQVVINGCATSVQLGDDNQYAPASIYFNILQCSFFSKNAINLNGNHSNASTIYVNDLSMTGCLSLNKDAIYITGTVRDFYFGRIGYTTESKDGYTSYDVSNVINITSRGTQTVYLGYIGTISTLNADNAVKIASGTANTSGVQFIDIKNIYKKYVGSAFQINYCSNVTIGNIYNGSGTSVLGDGTSICRVDKNNAEKITDHGSYNLIGNFGNQTRGGGVAPSPQVSWPVGCIVRETTDNKCYIRVANTGNPTDFIALN